MKIRKDSRGHLICCDKSVNRIGIVGLLANLPDWFFNQKAVLYGEEITRTRPYKVIFDGREASEYILNFVDSAGNYENHHFVGDYRNPPYGYDGRVKEPKGVYELRPTEKGGEDIVLASDFRDKKRKARGFIIGVYYGISDNLNMVVKNPWIANRSCWEWAVPGDAVFLAYKEFVKLGKPRELAVTRMIRAYPSLCRS